MDDACRRYIPALGFDLPTPYFARSVTFAWMLGAGFAACGDEAVIRSVIGATATPTWILPNGEVHSGAQPIEEVRRLLDESAAWKRR